MRTHLQSRRTCFFLVAVLGLSQGAGAAIVVPAATYSVFGGNRSTPYSESYDYSDSEGLQAVFTGLTSAKPSADVQGDVSGATNATGSFYPNTFRAAVIYYFAFEGPAGTLAPAIFASAGSAEAHGNASAEAKVEMRLEGDRFPSFAAGGLVTAGGPGRPDYAEFSSIDRLRIPVDTVVMVLFVSTGYMGVNGSFQAVSDPLIAIDYDEPDAHLYSLTVSSNILPEPHSLALLIPTVLAGLRRPRKH